MKNILLTCLMALGAFSSFGNVKVEVIDGTQNQTLKNNIEKNASAFLSEVYSAYESDRPLRLNGILSAEGQPSVEMLWENVHFRPEDQYVGEVLLSSSDGYQIRNIPLLIMPQDDAGEEDYKEAVINFNRKGEVASVYFSIDNNTYKDIMTKGLQLNDMERRLEILDYVERFRTSYNQKDLKFLDQVFSDDALIITGKVVTSRPPTDGVGISLPSIKYTKQTKKEYLNRLYSIFRTNKYINVKFDDVTIRRHPSNPDIYGVRVVQEWNTSRYKDEGYVFMLWDFSNPDAPQIHVRTWQPKYIDETNKIPLDEKDIFELSDFDI